MLLTEIPVLATKSGPGFFLRVKPEYATVLKCRKPMTELIDFSFELLFCEIKPFEFIEDNLLLYIQSFIIC